MRTEADRCALAAFALLALLVPPTLEFDFLPQNVLSGGGPASCHLPSGTPGKEEALISETLNSLLIFPGFRECSRYFWI